MELNSVCVFSNMVRTVIQNDEERGEDAKFSDLIPANPYPRQMSQGILALRYLLDSGFAPSKVGFCCRSKSKLVDYF